MGMCSSFDHRRSCGQRDDPGRFLFAVSQSAIELYNRHIWRRGVFIGFPIFDDGTDIDSGEANILGYALFWSTLTELEYNSCDIYV